MSVHLFRDQGTKLQNQRFTWKDLAPEPISKLDDDAFTRIRVLLMYGIESEASFFSHACTRMNVDLQLPLARLRRIEQHQRTLIHWLIGPDHSPEEVTISHEQMAIELCASISQAESDPYFAQVYRYGLLEHLDHLYRHSALMDRMSGKDANVILQNYTDIIPGRLTQETHRSPHDDLRTHYRREDVDPLTRFHAMTVTAAKNQILDHYMAVGPQFADPTARQLYAEIASTHEQHVTQYESMIDPHETWLEKWLLHEANEVYTYHSCVETESNPRIKAIWERFLDYELGQLQYVMTLFKQFEARDPAEILPDTLPPPLVFQSQREFIRAILESEMDIRPRGHGYVFADEEDEISHSYREQLNREGSPSAQVAGGYIYTPGTELTQRP